MHIGQDYVSFKINYTIMKAADLIIALTEYEKKFLSQNGISEEKIVVIGVGANIVNEQRKQSGEMVRKQYGIGTAPAVLFVGRREEKKGVYVLIAAMKEVWQSIPDAVLILAGKSSTCDNACEKVINALNEQEKKKVIVIKSFAEEDKIALFRACDLFAMPSIIDSFGIVYLEAWAQGKPVIACKDTPQETIIDDGMDGILVEYGNVSQTAGAIIHLLKNQNLRIELGKKGKEKVALRYSWDAIGSSIKEKYHFLAEKG